MSDKLQKTDSAIVPASKIADKIASALKDDKPANTGTRWPTAKDECKCGHKYSEHNYSDGLGSRKDPLGFMYECRGAGFSEAKLRKRPNGEIYQGAVCACEQFEFADAPVRIVTDETTCVDGLNLLQHNCPGAVENAAGGRTVCKCSCMSCLTAERIELAKANGDTQPERGVMVSGNGASVFTNSMTCVTCGSTRGGYGIRDHRSCAVVDTSTGSPIVCKCDCKDCKRLWFADGRPVARVENGKRIIVRENGSKQTFTTEIKVADPVEFVGDTAGEIELRQQAKVERFGMNALVQGLAADNDKITKDLREWAMQSERVAERKNFVGTDFEALEIRTLAASVTLPTETSLKNFDVKVIGENGEPVDLVDVSPEVEMPDLRLGCGAEFPTVVNGKTLRCKKWRGHEGNHSDKLDGVPINWTNK